MTSILEVGFLGLLIVALIVAPLMWRATRAVPGITAGAGTAPQPGRQPRVGGALTPSESRLPSLPAAGGASFADKIEEVATIDIDRVEGRVKASSVKKVGEIVEKHPDEALSIVRSWMYQEG